MKYDEIGEWSEIKLEIIKKYATAYTSILSKQEWCKGYAYIDAFAGAGWHIRKATGELIPGSPLNALLVEPPFTEYYYIDLDNERVNALKEFAKERPNVKVYHGDCNRKLVEDIFPELKYKSFKRALCVLDPYGINLQWKTVEYAGKLKTIDILINFSIMDMNRNVLFDDLSNIKKEDKERMNIFWGDASWQEVVYRQREDLFGGTRQVRIEDFHRLAVEYRIRLKKIADFKFVPEPILMRNSKNGPLYYLFFASAKPVAQKIIMDIFRSAGATYERR
jgi:three-Cys-motif partner protein